MAAPMISEPPVPPAKLNFVDLPRETQQGIIGHCSQSDLICVSLVSKHFRELAAAQLYHNFYIVFPDDDDPAFDSPIDGLAGGLDTFVTSDYDYAQHLKDFKLDTLSTSSRAENAYKQYLYNVSCGKFMNTLLLLTLRKAKYLETFSWNVRVELSREVYKALHRITTLKNVHIRLQAGPSLFEIPPPLPLGNSHIGNSPMISTFVPPSFLPPLPPGPLVDNMLPGISITYSPSFVTPSLPKHALKPKASKRPSAKEPPTLSSFKGLRSFAVLDVDSLDMITEVKSCVRNSASTLIKLKLSLSESLANQARKPPPDVDPDESDVDDEFQVVSIPAAGNSSHDPSGPAKAFRAQEERKSQETILGRIFDVEPYVVKKPHKRPSTKDTDTGDDSTDNAGRNFINAIKAVSNKLMKDLNGAGDFTAAQQEILDTIETAARKYVNSEEAKVGSKSKDDKTTTTEVTASSSSGSSAANGSSSAEAEFAEAPTEPQAPESGAPVPWPPKPHDLSPEDIDIEAPEGQLTLEVPDGPEKISTDKQADASSESLAKVLIAKDSGSPVSSIDDKVMSNVERAMSNLIAQRGNFKILEDKMESFRNMANDLTNEIRTLRGADGSIDLEGIADAEKRLEGFGQSILEIQNEMNIVEAEIEDAEKQIPLALANDKEGEEHRISEYVRSTRGMPLQSLSIFLVPVKASVLNRAVDIRALRRITLLNVGPQAPIWALLAKENKSQPLPLRKIFTDNVSTTFLTFVSQLDEVHELFMLERDAKYKPESFAPKSTTTIDQIRRLVLKKHIHKLKCLMIKNDADTKWDLDGKATLLICRRALKLEELAVNMNIRAIHTMMQNISGLKSLRALLVVHMRNEDTCVWVMRELKKFLIDNVSHHPHLKLEWVSIDDHEMAERIIRHKGMPKKSKKSKGKEKATSAGSEPGTGAFPLLPLDPLEGVSDSSEEDVGNQQLQKLETLEAIHFYDVWGVRIFKKEIVSGRL